MEKRRCLRIDVPEDKMTCRIVEPESLAKNMDFPIKNINMNGVSFLAEEPVEKEAVRLAIKFPFTCDTEAGIAWLKVVYSKKLKDKYVIGTTFIRKK